ncbi:hypothetical protein TNCV_3422791 [Trichonephila clavipes]|nr:hypothetical protein TNCV_3422791 [Trichonephila clavipes]
MSQQRMAHSATPQQKKARMSKSRMKAMLIVFFDKNGVVHSEFERNNSTVFLQARPSPSRIFPLPQSENRPQKASPRDPG